jgi:hypothetical protein
MSRYFGIVVIFPCLLILIYIISFLNYKAEARREILTIRADAAANRATEAALIEAQLNAHVDSYGTTIINPDFAWQAYRRVFLKSFNTGGPKVEAMMDAWVPAMLIAVNDGYYMRMVTSDGTTYQTGASPNSVKRFRFSQKIPYARVIGNEYIADTLSGTYIYSYTQGFGAQVRGIHAPVADTVGGIHDSRAIVAELVGAMAYMVELANDNNNRWRSQFYLPRQFLDNTMYSAVTFKGMTVMCLIQGFDLLSHDKLDVHSIAASQMVAARQVVLYTRGGRNYYAYLSDYSPGTFLTVVSSVEEAARLGHNPDPIYF